MPPIQKTKEQVLNEIDLMQSAFNNKTQTPVRMIALQVLAIDAYHAGVEIHEILSIQTKEKIS